LGFSAEVCHTTQQPFKKGGTPAPENQDGKKSAIYYAVAAQDPSQNALEEVPAAIPTNYVPSVEKFAEFIALGLAYGMLPDQQSTPLIGTGQMVDLSPDCHVPVKLYWHCWNLKSDLLKKLTQQLISQAKTLLEE
jgi:DNA-binding transcriptional LysR family regulator